MNAEEDANVTVVVRDGEEYRIGTSLYEDLSLTLIAVVSEDPESWEEMAAYWPRYRTPPVPDCLEDIAVETVAEEEARDAIATKDVWIFIDLPQKRVLTGSGYEQVGRKGAFAMVVDEDGTQHCPMMINLPPWWELHELVDAEMVDHPRETPIDRPDVNRSVLFGDKLLQYISDRVTEIVQTERWIERDAGDKNSTHPFTVEVHRDWLMTPRDELDGGRPREMLHGGIDWIDGLAHGQRLRHDDGMQIVAVPDDIEGFERDPMGREEVVIYFDLCRELISSAWSWCETDEMQRRLSNGEDCTAELVDHLRDVKEEWLVNPHEISATPEFIIECSRRRVPRGAGVPIVGMSESQPNMEPPDPDCPVCQMMEDGGFGTAFTGLDGHHLELDDEFAFSLCETREEWEEQQREFEQLSAEFERELEGDELLADGDEEEPEPTWGEDEAGFEPTWTCEVSDEPIPGDEDGSMQFAFLLAEIVSVLESEGATSQEIGELNDRFREFRDSDTDELYEMGTQLTECLESLTDQYPEITSRVADFCSRIDEHVCAVMLDDEDDADLPF